MRFFHIIFFIFLFLSNVYPQNNFTISGTIKNEKGELLIGTTVKVKGTTKGIITDINGNYSLLMQKGNHIIVYSFIGYESIEISVSLTKNIIQDVQLTSKMNQLDELVIYDNRIQEDIKSTEISVEKLTIQQVEKIPVILGETDIFKTIQLLPGVTGISEGQSGYIVRGSGFDQNLILMDEMPIYYSSHMQGLFSVFNSDAVAGLTLYKGGTPARFGGRGASVLDVRMQQSNFEKIRASIGFGLITSKFSLEAPLIKDKLSLFLAGRSTRLSLGYFYDQLIFDNSEDNYGKGGSKSIGGDGNTFFASREKWYDLNAKIIYQLNENNRFDFSAYFGQDYAITIGLTDWGNRAWTLKWNHIYNKNFFFNTSIIHSRYYTHNITGVYEFNSWVNTNSLKQEFSWIPSDAHDIRFGIQSEYQDFNHGGLQDTQDDGGKFMPPMQGLETAFYIQNDHKFNSWLSSNYGLRYSFYYQLGPGDSHVYDEESNESISSVNYPRRTDIIFSYKNLEPRLAFTFLLTENNSIKTSYNRNAQYLRLMTLGGDIQWYDIWMPTTANISPMLTDQVAVGYFHNFNDEIKFSFETYYKRIINAADFEDGLHNYFINNLEAYVATGKGKAYGLEVSVEKPKGRLNGRMSYNLGRSEYQIDVINNGRWYPNMFDKTHSLATYINYDLVKDLTLSTTFLYTTGSPVTLPEAYYNISGVSFPYWEGRNKYRLPNYNRLDFGLVYEPDYLFFKLFERDIKTQVKVSMYNVYNRRNIRAITVHDTVAVGKGKSGSSSESNGSLFQQFGISTYGFLPSFNINFKF